MILRQDKVVEFNGNTCIAKFGNYQNNMREAIRLIDKETGGPFAKATVNVPDVECFSGEVFIKNSSENEGMLDALIKAKVVHQPHRHFYCGPYYPIYVCRIREDKIKSGTAQVEFTTVEISDLDSALELAIEDQVNLIRSYGDDVSKTDIPDIKDVQKQNEKWLLLRRKLLSLESIVVEEDPWYTVVLLYPDYLSSDGDTFIEAAQGAVDTAIATVRHMAITAQDDVVIDPYDFKCLAVFPGDLELVAGGNFDTGH